MHRQLGFYKKSVVVISTDPPKSLDVFALARVEDAPGICVYLKVDPGVGTRWRCWDMAHGRQG
jgi:hypothetical protein